MISSSTITFGIYLAAVFGIGVYGYYVTDSFEDFALGGRNMSDWVVGLSASVSDMSIWLLIGFPAAAYTLGYSMIWLVLGGIFGTAFNWFVVSTRLRRYSEVLDSITFLDYLEKRVNDQRGFIKVFGTISMLVFYTFTTAGELVGAGTILNVVFGYQFVWGVVIGGILVLIYTTLGGFISSSYTDVLQSLVMLASVLILPIVGFIGIGSVTAGLVELEAASGATSGLYGGSNGLLAILGFIGANAGIGLGYFGQPHILVRFMSINDEKKLRRSMLVSMVWITVASYGAMFLGWTAGTYLGPVQDTDQIMPRLAIELLPPWLVGVLMAGAVAGFMSTTDSKFLVVTNSVAHNIYKRFINKDATDTQTLYVAKGTMVVIIALAMLLARPELTVFGVILAGFAGIGSSFGPVLVASLYWKRLTRQGAYAGMVVGLTTVIIWVAFDLVGYEMIPGIAFSSLSVIVVSLISGEPSQETKTEFEKMANASGLEISTRVNVSQDD